MKLPGILCVPGRFRGCHTVRCARGALLSVRSGMDSGCLSRPIRSSAFDFYIKRLFVSGKNFSKCPVSFAPSRQNLIGCSLAQDVADCGKQRIGDKRIILCLDAGFDMTRGHAHDGTGQRLQLVNILGIGENRTRQPARLFSAFLGCLIEHRLDVRIHEQAFIHALRNGKTMLLQRGRGSILRWLWFQG